MILILAIVKNYILKMIMIVKGHEIFIRLKLSILLIKTFYYVAMLFSSNSLEIYREV